MTGGAFHPPATSQGDWPPGYTKRGHAKGYALRTCEECPNQFHPIRPDGQYCSEACRNNAKNRASLRGRQIYAAAYHWVSCPVSERGSLATLMGNIARGWRDEDRAQGRKPPAVPVGLAEVVAVKAINDQAKGSGRLVKAINDKARAALARHPARITLGGD